MKKLVYESLNEFQRAQSDEEVKDRLGIGSLEERAKGVLKAFAEKEGYEFEDRESTRGRSLRMKVPISYEEKDPHGHVSKVNGLEYTITFPPGWEDTPMSLRKRWEGTKGYSGQNLIGRFANTTDLMKRLKVNLKNELKHVAKKEDKPEMVLLRAIWEGDTKKVKELLKSGVSPDHKIRSKITNNVPLLSAAERGETEIFKALVDAGARLDVSDRHGHTVISEILGSWSEKDRSEMLQYAIDHGADPLLGSMITWALQHNNFNLFKTYLDNIDISDLDPKGLADLLSTCAWMGYWKKLKMLLSKGADPNTKTNRGTLLKTALDGQETLSYRGHTDDPGVDYEKTIDLIKKAGGR